MRITASVRRPAFLALAVAAACSLYAESSLAAFGLSSPKPGLYRVDTNGGLVFDVDASGNITSLLYNGVQYADPTKPSGLNIGTGYVYRSTSLPAITADVLTANGTVVPAAGAAATAPAQYVRIGVTVTSPSGAQLVHYYLAKNGTPDIYMGTYFTEEPPLDLVRYIVRVPIGALPVAGPSGTPGATGPQGAPQDLRLTNVRLESGDIGAMSASGDPTLFNAAVNGMTRSKHYSNSRVIDWQYFGGRSAGGDAGVWFYRGNSEGGSGGPFYRCLLNQITSTHNELTYIVNYGEGQTEAMRTEVLNTYTLMFTSGAAPSAPDTSWFGLMNLRGYVGAAQRGTVAGVGLRNTKPQYRYTVALANDQAQYWANADLGNNGFYKIPNVLPGTYTMHVYKNELDVLTVPGVVVTAGGLNALHTLTIANDPEDAPALWRIGAWDGAPSELRNGTLVTTMHPSDVRMSSWSPGPFTVGVSQPTDFPAYLFAGVNATQLINFQLTADQAATDLRLRIGITAAFASGRPGIRVNGVCVSPTNGADTHCQTQTVASAQPHSRSLTVGTYRGNNTLYTIVVPHRALVAGANTLELFVVGSDAKPGYLSSAFSVDAVDLVPASVVQQ